MRDKLAYTHTVEISDLLSILWHDYLTADGMLSAGRKSLFDPCPAGWRVPDINTWSDFRMTGNVTVNITNDATTQRAFPHFDNSRGLCYWPYVWNVRLVLHAADAE